MILINLLFIDIIEEIQHHFLLLEELKNSFKETKDQIFDAQGRGVTDLRNYANILFVTAMGCIPLCKRQFYANLVHILTKFKACSA